MDDKSNYAVTINGHVYIVLRVRDTEIDAIIPKLFKKHAEYFAEIATAEGTDEEGKAYCKKMIEFTNESVQVVEIMKVYKGEDFPEDEKE